MDIFKMSKVKELPVIAPILGLLKSRKFIVAAVTLGIDLLVVAAPELESVQVELVSIATLVGSMLIGSIAYEDGKLKANTGAITATLEAVDAPGLIKEASLETILAFVQKLDDRLTAIEAKS